MLKRGVQNLTKMFLVFFVFFFKNRTEFNQTQIFKTQTFVSMIHFPQNQIVNFLMLFSFLYDSKYFSCVVCTCRQMSTLTGHHNYALKLFK